MSQITNEALIFSLFTAIGAGLAMIAGYQT